MAMQILRVLSEVAKSTPAIGLADSLVAIGLLDAPVNIPSVFVHNITIQQAT